MNRLLLGVIALALLFSTIAYAQYDLGWYQIAGGGATTSSGGGYVLGGTVGQHAAGEMAAGELMLVGGFWAAVASVCPADINGDGMVDIHDVLQLLLCWGPVIPGCESADIIPGGVVDIWDLLELLMHWGPCP